MDFNPDIPKKKRKQRMGSRLKIREISIKEWVRSLPRRAPMAGAFFLLSLAQCFSVPSPFAICCLVALWSVGARPKGAMAGLAAGVLFRLFWQLPLDAGQFIVCLLVYPLIRLIGTGEGQMFLLTAALLLGRAIPGIAAAEDGQAVILYVASAVLGLASLPALRRAAQLFQEKARKIQQDDLLCLALPFLLLITGAARLSAMQVNLGYTCAVGCVLTASWLCGGAWGACLGLGCGFSLLIGGQSALLLVNLAFGALMSGFFQGRSRLLTAGVYLLCSIASTYLIAQTLYPFLLAGEGAASLIFCLLPGRWVNQLGKQLRGQQWFAPRNNAYMRLKMEQWISAIQRMAAALPAPQVTADAPEEEREILTEELCAECERLPICWHENADQTQEGMAALARRTENTEDYLEIINRYFSKCPRISRLPDLLNHLDVERVKRMQRSICANYERDMLCTHLNALSQAAHAITLDSICAGPEEESWFYQSEAALQTLHFPGQTAFVKQVDGHMLVGLQCDPLALPPGTRQDLASQMSVHLHTHLTITQQDQGRILLEEEPPLTLVTGMATACAVVRNRDGSGARTPDNGDAVLVRSLPGGQEMLALSDGMGHGTCAQQESRKTLELLSLCMEAGYTRGQAMTAVNGAMLSATGGEQFATVDLCLVNLWNGETVMNKLGACASFILQGRKIHTVEGAALPLGIIEHAPPMEHTFTLGEGDVLLLLSDGVSDAFQQEADLLKLLENSREQMPQRIADMLLREALMQENGLPADDMTVLCAKVASRARSGK